LRSADWDVRLEDGEIPLSVEDWVDHLMRSADPRWREHSLFPYVVFNMIQKDRVWKSCRRVLKTRNVDSLTCCTEYLTPAAIEQAVRDLEYGERRNGYHSFDDIQDSNIRSIFKQLFKEINTITRDMELTDTAKLRQRKMLYSKQIYYGLPDLWVTINPGDVHSPLMLRLAGVELKMNDKGFWEDFPQLVKRRLAAIRNPVAVVLYANQLMSAFVEALLGFDEAAHSRSGPGVFGEPIRTYSWHQEEQNRGTLHWHGFVWFKNRPPREEFIKRLQSPAFQQRVSRWLDDTIWRSEPLLMKVMKEDPDAGHMRDAFYTVDRVAQLARQSRDSADGQSSSADASSATTPVCAANDDDISNLSVLCRRNQSLVTSRLTAPQARHRQL
jgi:hypothetical protein